MGKPHPLKEQWLEFNSKKYKIPLEHLRREFSDDLDGKESMKDPLQIPYHMGIDYKYSYAGLSRFFREIRDNQKLYATKCKKCGRVSMPPRPFCSFCYGDVQWKPLSGKGTVETFTVQYFSNSEFVGKVPFLVAGIKLEGSEGLLINNVIMEDVTKAKTGMKVKVKFHELRLGMITDFYFVPA